LTVGKKPFQSDDIMQVLAMHINQEPPPPRKRAPGRKISQPLEKVILRALAKNRDERYQDAGEFLAALDATPEGHDASRPKLGRTAPRGQPAVAAPAKPAPARRTRPQPELEAPTTVKAPPVKLAPARP